ncbi:hypothetical protein ACG3SL_17575 [Sphingomonas sp. CJ20]
MRLLTSYELDLVAGGTGSTDDSQLNGNDDYNGSWYGAGNSGGGGNGGHGGGFWLFVPVATAVNWFEYGSTSGWTGSWVYQPYGTGGGPSAGMGAPAPGEPNNPPAEPPKIKLAGFENCPVDQKAAQDALSLLYSGSATMRGLMDSAAAKGVGIDMIKYNPSQVGGQSGDRFIWQGDGPHNIEWDPFLAIEGTNSNGSHYSLSPVEALAHEFVHAAHLGEADWQGDASEAKVMALVNAISAELNTNTSSNFNTNRDNHIGNPFWVSTITQSTFAATQRPDCPN